MPSINRTFLIAACSSMIVMALACAAAAADAVRYDTPSGLPVPRFVSLKTAKTYCRQGPSFEHDVTITYMRRGLPVVVVAETTNHWRKIRDIDGDECWSHKSKLSGVRTAVVRADAATLYARASDGSAVRAVLARDVIVEVEGIEGAWARVEAAGRRGWTPVKVLWGADAEDRFAAAHN